MVFCDTAACYWKKKKKKTKNKTSHPASAFTHHQAQVKSPLSTVYKCYYTTSSTQMHIKCSHPNFKHIKRLLIRC